MKGHTRINGQIDRLVIPYKHIFTTVYLIRTADGHVLFDAASYDTDIDGYVLPWLRELGVTAETLRYIFISHNHPDHAGGLKRLMELFPQACIVSRSPSLREKFAQCRFLLPEDGEVLVGPLRVVTIPGHTVDGIGLLDRKSRILITGDCLQLYGIFGSDFWGANISYPAEHLQALEKLRGMELEQLLWAHDYHPMGQGVSGRAEVIAALGACQAPLLRVWALIRDNPGLDDGAIRDLYNGSGELPVMGEHVVRAIRADMAAGRI